MKRPQHRKGVSPLVQFLTDRRSYPEAPRRIQLLQTHASWVALLPRFVYKVKKPVKLGFLDFSTTEKRRRFCEREVALNRRLSSDIYLGVVPITQGKDGLAFDGPGRIVDYAVRMRRLPEKYSLLSMLRRGKGTPGDIDRIVALLGRFYSTHPSTPEIARWGRLNIVRKSTTENACQTRPFVEKTISPAAFEGIGIYNKEFYRLHRSLFESRGRDGYIRDCHGDLHLEHIHLGPKDVTIYDCIEFNDRFRMIDVANDVAFLAMDLDFRGRGDLGRYFAARMVAEMHDPDALRLLDFYKCYRACVRGKVESLRSVAAGLKESERLASRRTAKDYFRLALQYAVAGSKPLVLIVMGRVASGKSTLARALGKEMGWDVFSSDRLRKEIADAPLCERGDAAQRKHLYSRTMSDRTYATLLRHALQQIQKGRSVIMDATFGSQERRGALRKALERARVNFCFIEACTSTAVMKRRLRARDHSSREVSDARLEDLPTLDQAYQTPTELDPAHLISFKTSDRTELVVATVLAELARRSARASQDP